MKILIVDDIGYSRLSLEMVLQRAGHKVIQAKGGGEALAALKVDHTVELVITDLMMPDMDGVELFKHAKQLERINDDGHVDLPEFILLTTAQLGRSGTTGNVESRLRLAEEVGFAAVLHKPLDQKRLLNAVDKIEAADGSDVPQSIGQIQGILNSVIERQDREEAALLLECFDEQGPLLQQLVANADDDG